MKIFLIILASVTGVTVLSEVALRLIMGLGNPPLYIADLDKKPTLALIEYYQLFIASPDSNPEVEQLKAATPETERLSQNLAAIKEIKAIADASQTKFILVLTPLLREFESGSSESESAARKRLQELVLAEQIDYIDILAEWADFPQPEFLYRDREAEPSAHRIHPTPQGNSKIIEAISEQLAN